MVSKTEVANRALSKLGEERVSNIETTNTKAARTINTMYDIVRDAVMQSAPWNFAIKRASLAEDATAPAWGYDNRFSVPSDMLSLLSIYNDPDYQIEAGYILTDEGAPLKIRYIYRAESEGTWSPMFIEAFAARLAYESCEAITESNTKKDGLLRDYNLALQAAYAADAIENPADSLPEDEWLEARD